MSRLAQALLSMTLLSLATGCSARPSTPLTADGGLHRSELTTQTISVDGQVNGIARFSHWLSWNPIEADGTTRSTTVMDLSTGERRFVATHDPRSMANLSVGVGDTLLQREITPVALKDCAPGSFDCYVWQVWQVNLEDGSERLIARSDKPRPQSANPILVADDRYAAWQQYDGRRIVTMTVDTTTGTSMPRAAGVFSSKLSIDHGILAMDDGRKAGRLVLVSLTSGGVRNVDIGAAFLRPDLNAGRLSWATGKPVTGMSVHIAPLTTLQVDQTAHGRTLFQSQEVYESWPLPDGGVAVTDFQGLSILDVRGTGPDPIAYDPVARVVVRDNVLVYATRDAQDSQIHVIVM